uniref:Ig-like domain-containing protein n=1 Tax=Ascaris lumbricoides TaxID=6252 RepID=A0A0M3I1L7_ASCLU
MSDTSSNDDLATVNNLLRTCIGEPVVIGEECILLTESEASEDCFKQLEVLRATRFNEDTITYPIVIYTHPLQICISCRAETANIWGHDCGERLLHCIVTALEVNVMTFILNASCPLSENETESTRWYVTTYQTTQRVKVSRLTSTTTATEAVVTSTVNALEREGYTCTVVCSSFLTFALSLSLGTATAMTVGIILGYKSARRLRILRRTRAMKTQKIRPGSTQPLHHGSSKAVSMRADDSIQSSRISQLRPSDKKQTDASKITVIDATTHADDASDVRTYTRLDPRTVLRA